MHENSTTDHPETMSLDVAGLIRRVRREADLSQRELAERLGTTQRYIWEIEAGKPSIFMERLFAMMREVDVELSATIRSPKADG